MLLKARNVRARCVLLLREYARCKTASARVTCYVLARVEKQSERAQSQGAGF